MWLKIPAAIAFALPLSQAALHGFSISALSPSASFSLKRSLRTKSVHLCCFLMRLWQWAAEIGNCGPLLLVKKSRRAEQ